jgi:hypothetical protein
MYFTLRPAENNILGVSLVADFVLLSSSMRGKLRVLPLLVKLSGKLLLLIKISVNGLDMLVTTTRTV